MIKKWLQLCVACLTLFLFTLAVKKLQTILPPLQKIATEIEAKGLESDALFYSESPKAVEAAFRLQQQME